MEKQNPPPYTATEAGFYPPAPGPIYPNIHQQIPPQAPQQHTGENENEYFKDN